MSDTSHPAPPWYYRLARRFCPAEFRREFGADLADTTAALHRDATAGAGQRDSGSGRRWRCSGRAGSCVAPRRTVPPDVNALTFGEAPCYSIYLDLRHAIRALRRRPLFTLLATGTLGIGLGATTAIFSVFEGVILRPLPYPDPEDLVMVRVRWTARDLEKVP